MRFEAGAGNVVPESAEFLIEFRDTNACLLADGDAAIESIVSRVAEQTGCRVSRTKAVNAPPVAMDASMIGLVEASVVELGLSHQRMPSAAGHDAMNVALEIPTGMIFVRSIAGRSRLG